MGDVRYTISIVEVNPLLSDKSTYTDQTMSDAKKNILTKIKNIIPRKRSWEINLTINEFLIKTTTDDLDKTCKNLEKFFFIETK
jgi:hypothetical protein